MTLSTPSECADWFDQAFGRGAAVMIEPRAAKLLEDYGGRATTCDSLTTLRWLSRPVGQAARLLALSASGSDVLLLHIGADPVSGAIQLRRLSSEADSAGNQLRALGLSPIAEDEDDALVEQEQLARALVFAVVSLNESPGEAREQPPTPDAGALPADIYAPEFIGLANQFGAPLEAVWHITWELSGVRSCLLNAGLDVADVERIPYRTSLSTQAFMDALRACNEAGLTYLDLPVYVVIGDDRGHAIHVEHIDDRQVVYHDPWPGRSLLAAGNNSYGVAALPTDDSRPRWRVPTAEFARVAYASLVEPAVWLALCGLGTNVRYRDLAAADLFTFFGLTETGRTPDAEANSVTISLKPGNWREHIDVNLTVDGDDAVRRATLVIDRVWLDSPSTAPFAADLLASFVGAVVTEADADETDLLRAAVRSIPSGTLPATLAAGPAHVLDPFRMVAMTIAGQVPFARTTLPCSTLRVFNGDQEGVQRVVVVVTRPIDEIGVLFEDRQSGYFMNAYRESLFHKTRAEMERLGLLSGGAGNPAP